MPPHGETPAIKEIERLYLDMIAAARVIHQALAEVRSVEVV